MGDTPRIILGPGTEAEAKVATKETIIATLRLGLEEFETGNDFGHLLDKLKWIPGKVIIITDSTGGTKETVITGVNYNAATIDVSINDPTSGTGFLSVNIGDKITLKDGASHGLSVSVPGVDVTNTWHGHSGNLMFDTSDFIENAMYAVQTGSFVLAGYKHRHDPTFHAGNRTNVSISIAETKPQGQELDIPMILMQFAVCNSSGYFHPNYADAANSQVLGYMDSIWVKQLNVIGGTINTESLSIDWEESDETYAGKEIGLDTDSLGWGRGFTRWVGPVPGGSRDENISEKVHPRAHPISNPNYVGLPYNQPESHYWYGVDGNTPGARGWLDSRINYPIPPLKTGWEPLQRPDSHSVGAVPSASYAESDSSGSLVAGSYHDYLLKQGLPPYGPLATNGSYAKHSTGRTGYWKQKTWGLIYYVDHKKIIVQAFNDKSTSNAMNTGTSTMHRDAWTAGDGDLGRVIGSTSLYQKDWSGGSKTGGAFNHNLNHSGDEYSKGAGDPIFDYYHVGSGKNTKNHFTGGYFGHPGGPTIKWSNATQEHMPRPYLGGYDNMMWDNVPFWNETNSNASPWMSCSGSTSGMAGWNVNHYNGIGAHQLHGVSFYSDFDEGNSHSQWEPSYAGDPFPESYGNYFTWLANGRQEMGSWGGPAFEGDHGSDYLTRTWRKWDEVPKKSGTLSYREAIAPNTEVTTVLTNHFNPLSGDMHGGEALDVNGDPQGWDYFFVSYVVFNQSTGMQHNPNLRQFNADQGLNTNRYIFDNLEFAPHNPIEPMTGQPLHD